MSGEISITRDQSAETPATVSDGAVPDREPLGSALANYTNASFNRLEAWLLRASDWLNPILVKETRQALKSWQFAWAFVLLLVGCWIVTVGGVAFVGPSIYYAAAGGDLLLWYVGILAFFLTVIVPYSTFRSLASEREDNTYDLLSITSLRPRQIISGKLGSAAVQMIVYFSAITPCLAFTYLLRGVDVPTIALMLAYLFVTSLALAMIGLLLATLARQRFAQVALSVGFVALLLFVFWMAIAIAVALRWEAYALFGDREFWIAHLALGSLYLTTFALAYFAAAGMITFATENRSTPLRIVMLIQQACWIGWMGYAWIYSDYEVVVAFIVALLGGIYWYAMGTMLSSEQHEMSRRVMRRLPQSLLGRVFLTWLNPGPCTGYMFAVANLTTIAVVSIVASASSNSMGGSPRPGEVPFFVIIGWGYVVGYLGIGRLVVTLLRRVTVVTTFAGTLIQVLLLLVAIGVPNLIRGMSVELRAAAYSYVQVTDPISTLIYLGQFGSPPEMFVLVIVVPAAAVCVLLMNLPGVVREIRRVRVALPARVAEDEAELHPPEPIGPSNPWEADEPGVGHQESGSA